MPSPRSLYRPSLRGFICNSCASKLLRPRRPWASTRNIASESARPSRRQGPARSTQKPPRLEDTRFFEEQTDGTQKEVDEHGSINKLLEQKIAEMEGNLEAIKSGKITPKELELWDDLRSGKLSQEEQEIVQQMSEMTDEQRGKLLRTIGKAKDHFYPKPQPAYHFDIYYENSSEDSVTGHKQFVIRKLVLELKKMALGKALDERQQAMLWTRYTNARKLFHDDGIRISPDCWTFLWHALHNTADINSRTLSRLKILAEDMQSVGVTLTDAQILFYLDAWYLGGHRSEALDRWRSLTGSLGKTTSAVFGPYWVLGIRMLALESRAQEALDAVAVLFKDAPDSDPRIVIPVINAWLVSDDERRLQKAWLVYQHVHSALYKTIQMKDYDAIAEIFLQNDLPGLALGVFRDMMACADHKNDPNAAPVTLLKPDFVQLSLDTTHGEDLEITHRRMQDIDWSEFQALARLPKKKRNRFFFGSWIKKLLGENDVTGALQVVRLMDEYRIRPASVQQNGILGALLRSKNAKAVAMGEKMGWEMIRVRLESAAASQRKPVLNSPATLVLSAGKNDYLLAAGALRTVPPATAETLALLIESYRRRRLHDYVEDLRNVLKWSGLRPTTYILNQFLLSYHRIRDYHSAMDIYNEFYHHYRLTPNIDTVKWLWHICKQEGNSLNQRPPPNQHSVRWLFATTVKYLPSSANSKIETEAMAEIYDVIIGCFGRVDDQVGTAIAVRVFQVRYAIYPTEPTIQKIIRQVALSDGTMPTMKKPFQRRSSQAEKEAEIKEVLQGVVNKRFKVLKARGVDPESMDVHAKGRENVFILTELLRSLYDRKVGSLAAKKARIAEPYEMAIITYPLLAEEAGELDVAAAISKDRLLLEREMEYRDVIDKYRKTIDLEQNFKTAAGIMGVPGVRPWDD